MQLSKEAAEARPSLHVSKCHIVGNLMHWLNCVVAVSVLSHFLAVQKVGHAHLLFEDCR